MVSDKLQSSGSPYYNFSNIRYGQAPVGSLRFAPPVPPFGRNTTINDGQSAVIPPQGAPGQSRYLQTAIFFNMYV
jgi:carboxylesterase type B